MSVTSMRCGNFSMGRRATTNRYDERLRVDVIGELDAQRAPTGRTICRPSGALLA